MDIWKQATTVYAMCGDNISHTDSHMTEHPLYIPHHTWACKCEYVRAYEHDQVGLWMDVQAIMYGSRVRDVYASF